MLNTTRTGKKVMLTILVLALVAGGLLAYSYFSESAPPDNDDSAKTTSTEPSAQEDFNLEDIGVEESSDRQAGNTIREDQGSAGISDTAGSISPSSLDRSNPIKSATGEITVFSPAKNIVVNDRVTVAGESSLGVVMYRISDNLTGLIATGSLSVVNGRFSGTLAVDTGAKLGRLDLYGARTDGNEFSNISIPLRFR